MELLALCAEHAREQPFKQEVRAVLGVGGARGVDCTGGGGGARCGAYKGTAIQAGGAGCIGGAGAWVAGCTGGEGGNEVQTARGKWGGILYIGIG